MMMPLNDPGQPMGFPLGVETGFAAANNENAEWSVQFIDYMTNGDGFYVYQNGRANLPYILDPDTSRLIIDDRIEGSVSNSLADSNMVDGPFWFMIAPPGIVDEIFNLFPRVMTNEITPAQAAEEMQAAWSFSN